MHEVLHSSPARYNQQLSRSYSVFQVLHIFWTPKLCNLFVQVKFKHYYRDCLLHPFAKDPVRVGDLVRVDADRGEDVGHVTAIASLSKKPSCGHLSYILRLGTDEEKCALPLKAIEEWNALEVCREKTCAHQLAMNILDAGIEIFMILLLPNLIPIVAVEYQFDRKKLTFFFEAGG